MGSEQRGPGGRLVVGWGGKCQAGGTNRMAVGRLVAEGRLAVAGCESDSDRGQVGSSNREGWWQRAGWQWQ